MVPSELGSRAVSRNLGARQLLPSFRQTSYRILPIQPRYTRNEHAPEPGPTSVLLTVHSRSFRIDDSANYSHISLQHTIQIFLFVAPLVTVVENGLKGPSGRVSRTITSTSQEQMDRKAGGLHAPTRCKHDNMNWHIYNHY